MTDDPEIVYEQILLKATKWAALAGWKADDPDVEVVAQEFFYYVKGRLCDPGDRTNRTTGEREPAAYDGGGWGWLKTKWKAFVGEYRATSAFHQQYTPLDDLLHMDADTETTVPEATLPNDNPLATALTRAEARERYEALRAELPRRQQTWLDEFHAAVTSDDELDLENKQAIADAIGKARSTSNSRLEKLRALREKGKRDAEDLDQLSTSGGFQDEHYFSNEFSREALSSC